MKPQATPPTEAYGRNEVRTGLPRTQPGAVERPRQADGHDHDQRDGQPALDRRERDPGGPADRHRELRASWAPSVRSRRDREVEELVLGQRVAQGPGLHRGVRARLERSGADGHDHGGDPPAAEAGQRPDPGPVERRRDHHRGHPPAQPGQAGQEALDERRRTVTLDRREELHDLEVLPAAAIGGQDRHPVAVGRQADGPVLAERLVGDRGRDPDADLDARRRPRAFLDACSRGRGRATRRRSARGRTP